MSKPAQNEVHLSGELQRAVMGSIWELGGASVDTVRTHLSPRQLAYTTVQTILNRLVTKGFLRRERHGNAYVYSAELAEAEFLTSSLSTQLSRASRDARRVALTNLVGELSEDELDNVAQYAERIRKAREGQ